jgi:hypothetical protein
MVRLIAGDDLALNELMERWQKPPGADRAGLDFAIETGLEHGGYVPRGRKAEDGRIDDCYNLIELSTHSYPARTRRNIEKAMAP